MKYLRSKKILFAFFMLFMAFSIVLNNGSAQALSSIWTYGVRTGYFQPWNQNIRSCYQWDPGGSGRDCFVIPEGLWGVNSVPALMNVLKSNYYSGNFQRQTGAAYIVDSMRGVPQGSRNNNPTVTPAEFDDLQNRLNYAASYPGGINWYYDGYFSANNGGLTNIGVADIYISTKSQRGPAIVISDPAGNPVYALFIECANPDGNLANGIPYIDYNLVPGVTVTPDTSDGGGGAIATATPTVTNAGGTASNPAQWQVVNFTVPPTGTVPPAAHGTTTPAGYYGNGAVMVANGNQQFPRGTTNLPPISQPIPDLPVGSQFCYATSVQPSTQNDTSWYYGTPRCVTISKKPTVHVLSGDLNVGRGTSTNPAATSNVITSTVTKGTNAYGSWAEYGIVPSGTVKAGGMASGAGYSGGTNKTFCDLSLLTFTTNSANGTSCGTSFGQYVQATIAPDVSARFPINVAAADAKPGLPANPAVLTKTSFDIVGDNLSGQYQAPAGATNLTITGGNQVPKGRWVVINAPAATVTITGNISYTNARLNAMADIPQVVIIAKNIIIADSVTQIDSWLVAVGSGVDGRINTCGAGGVGEATSLTFKLCDKQLTVNGPVITNHLIMRRTGGADAGAGSGSASEVFNLRADSYIWATNYNLNSGRLSTVSTVELPPRF